MNERPPSKLERVCMNDGDTFRLVQFVDHLHEDQ